MKRLAAAVLALAFLAGDASAKCAMQVLDDEIVTHPGDEIPAGGGVLVTWLQHSYQGAGDRNTGDADPTLHADWRFRQRGKKLKTSMVTIAPGLTVYVPKVAKGKRAKVTLEKKAYTIGKKKRALLPDAPVVANVTRTEHQDRRSHSIHVKAELGAAVPADAYALVVYENDVAISWHLIEDPAATTQWAYKSPGRCGTEPPGMQAPAVRDSLTFAWVDRFGQLSPRSAAVVVE